MFRGGQLGDCPHRRLAIVMGRARQSRISEPAARVAGAQEICPSALAICQGQTRVAKGQLPDFHQQNPCYLQGRP